MRGPFFCRMRSVPDAAASLSHTAAPGPRAPGMSARRRCGDRRGNYRESCRGARGSDCRRWRGSAGWRVGAAPPPIGPPSSSALITTSSGAVAGGGSTRCVPVSVACSDQRQRSKVTMGVCRGPGGSLPARRGAGRSGTASSCGVFLGQHSTGRRPVVRCTRALMSVMQRRTRRLHVGGVGGDGRRLCPDHPKTRCGQGPHRAGHGQRPGRLYHALVNKTPLIVTAGTQRRFMQNQYCLLTNIDPTTVPKPFVKWAAEPDPICPQAQA